MMKMAKYRCLAEVVSRARCHDIGPVQVGWNSTHIDSFDQGLILFSCSASCSGDYISAPLRLGVTHNVHHLYVGLQVLVRVPVPGIFDLLNVGLLV